MTISSDAQPGGVATLLGFRLASKEVKKKPKDEKEEADSDEKANLRAIAR